MSTITHSTRNRRSVRLVVASIAIVVALGSTLVGGVQAGATMSASATRSADWIASQIGPDGSVLSPITQTPSVNYTMYALLGLASTGLHPDAQDRALAYVGAHVDDWVVSSSIYDGPLGVDLPGRLGYLLMVVRARGVAPTAFGTPSTDLVARLEALYGSVEPGVYGTQNLYSAVTDQSLAILGLVAAGATVPSGALDWLETQQCGATPNPTAAGGWQASRAVVGGVLADCDAPDPVNYVGADTNSTSFAIQALVAGGRSTALVDAATFLEQGRSPGPGFAWFPGGDADPNSTGLVVQAIVAMGQSPIAAPWLVGGSSPIDALDSMTVQSGPDAGAMWFPSDPNHSPDLLATYQGIWGSAETAFPFPVGPVTPPSTTTTVATPPIAPAFTG